MNLNDNFTPPIWEVGTIVSLNKLSGNNVIHGGIKQILMRCKTDLITSVIIITHALRMTYHS